MKIIACYDITDNKRLNKVAKVMKNYGVRVQLSVFELDIEEYLFKRLLKEVNKIIDTDTDSVRYYKLCSECESSIDIIGYKIYVSKEEEFYIL